MSFALDPTTIGVIFAVAAVIFSVIWALLIRKGTHVGAKLVSLKESELQGTKEESTKAYLSTLATAMDDVKHRLDEIQTSLDEIRELLKSTV